MGFVFCSLEYYVGALECDFGVCLFEKVGDLPNFGAVIREGGPFPVLVVFSYCIFLKHISRC
jgi:hypothetical protein